MTTLLLNYRLKTDRVNMSELTNDLNIPSYDPNDIYYFTVTGQDAFIQGNPPITTLKTTEFKKFSLTNLKSDLIKDYLNNTLNVSSNSNTSKYILLFDNSSDKKIICISM